MFNYFFYRSLSRARMPPRIPCSRSRPARVKEAANSQVQEFNIEELGGAIATDEANCKAATEIRNKEQATFEAEEENLVETGDSPERGISIMEPQMTSGAPRVHPATTTDPRSPHMSTSSRLQ